jgi:hypothetical protein
MVLLWSAAALLLVAARWIDPPTTAVHVERRLQAWIHHKPYRERYKFIPLSQISPNLQHAVISAEDARFYEHHGFDWHAIQIDAEDDMEGGRTRGASTITQQLVKNLFFGTSRSIIRKGAETTLVPVAEFVAGQAAHSGDLPERGGMGPWHLWRGCGVPLPLRRLGAEYRPGRGGTAGCDFAGSAETTARAHESLQRGYPGADAAGGLVNTRNLLLNVRAGGRV